MTTEISARKATALNREDSCIFTPQLEKVLQEFMLDDEQLNSIANRLLLDMKKGLGKDTNAEATVKMIPSYVTSLPDGSEEGKFLALDLGGTNFRVLLVSLVKGGKPEMDSQIYKMPEDVITGSAEQLFDHIAACMSEFLRRLDIHDEMLPVGFTFSFPCKQSAIDKASLITWTKGFTASGVVGQDIVKLLEAAIARRNDFTCQLIAVVNDTVGTLMSCAYTYPCCKVGLIVGTGSNTCYMEKSDNVELLDEKSSDEMCINMEWGAFGDDGVLDDIRNEFDQAVDDQSLNKGKQLYEKMISGMYMGEITRLVLCKLTEEGEIFDGKGSEALFTPHKFESSYVSQIERTAPFGMTALQNILARLDIGAIKTDCEVVQNVCEAVSTRAAHLCAAGIAAVVRKIKANSPASEELSVTVGVDGTVYKKHPTFANLLTEKANQLVQDENIKINFALSYDGSGKGAALITAVAQKQKFVASS